MKHLLFVLVVALLPTVGAANENKPAEAPRYDRMPANQWVLVYREDAAGGKTFARAVWAEGVDRLYLWDSDGIGPMQTFLFRYDPTSIRTR